MPLMRWLLLAALMAGVLSKGGKRAAWTSPSGSEEEGDGVEPAPAPPSAAGAAPAEGKRQLTRASSLISARSAESSWGAWKVQSSSDEVSAAGSVRSDGDIDSAPGELQPLVSVVVTRPKQPSPSPLPRVPQPGAARGSRGRPRSRSWEQNLSSDEDMPRRPALGPGSLHIPEVDGIPGTGWWAKVLFQAHLSRRVRLPAVQPFREVAIEILCAGTGGELLAYKVYVFFFANCLDSKP